MTSAKEIKYMARFTIPRDLYHGKGSLDALKSLKGSKAIVVVGGGSMKRFGFLDKVVDYLKETGMEVQLFEGVEPDPSVEIVMTGAAALREFEPDWIISIGGGSPIDAAKAMWAFYEYPETTFEDLCIPFNFPTLRTKAKFCAIPSTSGTATEVTAFSVITDYAKGIKYPLADFNITPDVAIVDPDLAETMPAKLTAHTGMDALTHAVEAYTSRKANQLTDPFALSAIKRIFEFLPLAYKDGENKKAREEMAVAAYEAGVCINNSSVTIVHGMSRPIGAMFHVPHGISNAMLIKECLTYVLDGSYERFGAIGRAIGAADNGKSNEEAAEAFLEKLSALCIECEISTLAEYGINKEEFMSVVDKMAQDAMDSGSPSNTIKEVTKQDLLNIYNKLW
jgi:alcohol dehydrogenase class IV